jgi:MFS family permease
MISSLSKQPGFFQVLSFRILRGIAAGVIVVTFPYFIVASFAHGELILGICYAVGTVVSALAGLLFGIWFDKRPTKMLTLGVVSLLAFGLLVLAIFPHELWFVLLASALAGVSATGSMTGGGSGGVAAPIQGALIAHLIPDEYRTEAYSFLTFIAGIAAAAGVAISGALSMDHLFWVGVIAAFLSLVPVAFLPEKAFTHVPIPFEVESKKTLKDFSITGLLNGFSQGLALPFLVPLFMVIYGAARGPMAFYSSLAGIIGSFALLAAPWLDRRFGLVMSMILSRGASIIALLAIIVVHSFPIAIFLFLIFPALRVVAMPIQQRAITDLAGEGSTGTVLGANQGTRLLSAAGGSAIAGYLFDRALITLPFYAYAVIAASNLVLYKKFFGKR